MLIKLITVYFAGIRNQQETGISFFERAKEKKDGQKWQKMALVGNYGTTNLCGGLTNLLNSTQNISTSLLHKQGFGPQAGLRTTSRASAHKKSFGSQAGPRPTSKRRSSRPLCSEWTLGIALHADRLTSAPNSVCVLPHGEGSGKQLPRQGRIRRPAIAP